jgi:putative heme-binding domain-containing protein
MSFLSHLFPPILARLHWAKPLPLKKFRKQLLKQADNWFVPVAGWTRQNIDEMKILVSALEASGGSLPTQKMPQDLNDQQVEGLAKLVREKGDPAKGELIFRKAESSCTTCHAIGGAGGLIGPDLSSLGTSSPAETIIKSLLFPSASIKEGYDLKRRCEKRWLGNVGLPGQLMALSEVVIRDVTGKEVSIPKSQVQVMEKVPGSLMPPGLTASLDQTEFVNLVGFLTKLGESGDFRVPNTQVCETLGDDSGQISALTFKTKPDVLGRYAKRTNRKWLGNLFTAKFPANFHWNELPDINDLCK